MRALSHILILTLLITLGCGHNANNYSQGDTYDKNTQLFSEYLQYELGVKIPDDTHFFLIVLKDGCQGAIESTLMDLDSTLNVKNDNTNVSIITSNKQLSNKYFSESNIQIYLDRTIDVINLPIYNVSLIKTRNSQVLYILSEKNCSKRIGKDIVDSLTNKSF